MSIKLSLDSLDYKLREKIHKDLKFSPSDNKKFQSFNSFSKQTSILTYHIDNNNNLYLPFSYALKTLNAKRKERSEYSSINIKFTQSLRDGQKDAKNEIISLLNNNGSCILSFYPGFGKTSLSIYIASVIKLKTVVIVHRLVLLEQWCESIKKFCPDATYSIIKPKYNKKDLDCDFLLVNAINVEKIGQEAFKDCGNLIVDEIHTIATESLSKSLYYITPRYLIGLSATPTRPDKMDAILDVYFGKEKITKSLHRKHQVYQIETGLTPEVKLSKNGTVDWNSIIEFQSNNLERNDMILKIIDKFKDRYFLVLTKRVSQATYLYNKLKEKNESVGTLIGNENKYDEKARVLIATVQKCGVGFSHDILNTLILGADLEEYFIQYLGRVMRTEEGDPIVFDLVDDNKILKRHFSTRKKVYTNAGGVIKKISIDKII